MNWGRLFLGALIGGFENVSAKEHPGDGAPSLQVNATVLFGGL